MRPLNRKSCHVRERFVRVEDINGQYVPKHFCSSSDSHWSPATQSPSEHQGAVWLWVVCGDRSRARFKPSHFSRSVAIPNVLRFVLSADRALGLAPSNAAIVESTDMELKREVG